MRANEVEAAIARYREAGTKKRCAQSELHAYGERVVSIFIVSLYIHLTEGQLNAIT